MAIGGPPGGGRRGEGSCIESRAEGNVRRFPSGSPGNRRGTAAQPPIEDRQAASVWPLTSSAVMHRRQDGVLPLRPHGARAHTHTSFAGRAGPAASTKSWTAGCSWKAASGTSRPRGSRLLGARSQKTREGPWTPPPFVPPARPPGLAQRRNPEVINVVEHPRLHR